MTICSISTSEQVNIRPMVKDDIPRIYTMLRELAEREKLEIVSLQEFRASFFQQDLPNQFMIMEKRRKGVGFCGIQIWEQGVKQGYAGLRGPAVDAVHQGGKLAQHLLKVTIPLAVAKGLQKVRAMIRSDNRKGIHLAEKYGMQPVSHCFTMRLYPLKSSLRPLPDGFRLCPMREEEKDLVLNMIKEIFIDSPELSSDVDLKFRSPSLDPRDVLLCLGPTGEMIGFVWIELGRHDKDTGLPIAELVLGGLRKPYRGKWLFPRGMDYIVDYVTNKGVKFLELGVESCDAKAKGLYEKVGFKTVTSRICYQGCAKEMIERLEQWHDLRSSR